MNPVSPRARFLVPAVATLLLLSACTTETAPPPGGTGTTAAAPPPIGNPVGAVRDVECADDVFSVVVGSVRCQLVTVPEERGATPASGSVGGRTVQLHLARITPPGGTRNSLPILVAGTNIGTTPNYLGISPLAQRTGREVIILDARGTGHSIPSLDCPEVRVAADAVVDRTSSAAADAVNGAVELCASRLGSEGIDPTAYDLAALGADLNDVRAALGLETVDVAAYGSSSLAVNEMLHASEKGVHSVLLDSPVLPGSSTSTRPTELLTQVVDSLLARCRRETACGQQYLARGETLERARQVVAVRPLRVDLPERNDRASALLLDEERLLRLLRQMTSDGGSSGTAFTLGAVPRLVHDVIQGDVASLNRWLSPVVGTQDVLCLGRSPSCLVPRHHLSVGALLVVACAQQDIAGTVTYPLQGLGSDDGVCAHWPQQRTASAPPAWAAPTFVAIGAYNTYQSPDAVRGAVADLGHAVLLEDPAAGNGVMARTECTLTARDRWLDHPDVAPDSRCVDQLGVEWA